MKRRQFLKALTAGGMGAVSTGLLGLNASLAQAAEGKSLVVIFQRGGCDGLNMVVPHGEDEYYNLRRSISIRRNEVLDLDGFFGLHPSLSGLLPIFMNGNLALLPTTQYNNSSHSHFDGERFIESGVAQEISDGWLNRHLSNSTFNSGLRAVSFSGSLDQSLRGPYSVSTFGSLADFEFSLSGAEEQALFDRLLAMYQQTPSPNTFYRHLVHNSGQIMLNSLAAINNIDFANYAPENGANYPSSTFGRQLAQTAQLLKQPLPPEIISLNIGGWDTHSDQGGAQGRQATQFQQLGGGIEALYTDLGGFNGGGLMDDVVILTTTEFGRTAKQNGSNGTDHGDASNWMVISNSVQGGIYGTWPGLLTSQLADGRYLLYTVDYRNIYADILRNHLGNNTLMDTLLPGWTHQPLGLFG
ncbi:DUF1501 domain-containing protein [Pseudomonadota bacterium]